MVRRIQIIIVGVVIVGIIYYAVIFYILRYSLDQFVLPRTNVTKTNEIASYRAASDDGNELLIRRYGNGRNGCVVFFPGQHGGVARYEKDLFSSIANRGILLFAISYPGQDGAKGRARFDQLQELLDSALTMIDSLCSVSGSVFVGRSLGSMVAAIQANQWHPRGLVLEGISPRFSDAMYTYMASKWYLRLATVLPVSRILKEDYSLEKALDKLASTKVVIFQGSLDLRTPLPTAKKLIEGRRNVQFIEVEGATHSDTYIKAMPNYINRIEGLLN